MFKALITTCLLTFSSCTGIGNDYQYKEHRNNAVSYGGLYGAYVLRDDFTDKLNSYISSHQGQGWYSFEITFTEYDKQIDGLFSNGGNLDIGYLQLLRIGVGAYTNLNNSEIDFFMEINKSDTIYTDITIDEEDANNYNTLNKWINSNVGTNQDSVKYHTLYFNGNINLVGQSYELFDIFYTSTGNAYNTYYNGYYHCTNSITWSYYSTFQCQIIVDNVLYTYMSFEPNSWYAIYDYDEQITVPIYYNGWKVKDMNVFLNGMIPNSIYNMLGTKGTFSYVQPQPPSDFSFQDFFFGIADTPLYYAWSLLNWDLFGLNLFVAFCALCTLT